MVSSSTKSSSSTKRKRPVVVIDAEERALQSFNRMIAKAAPLAAKKAAAALTRYHRGIAAEIRRRN